MAEATKSWWSQAILVGAVIAAVLLMLGPLGTRFGIWTFTTGIPITLAAAGLAAIGLLVGVVAFVVTLVRKLPEDRAPVLIGVIVSALILGVMGLQVGQASSVPPIHNISTDVLDPPRFDAVVALRGEGTNPLEYVAAQLAEQQQKAYPWVKPLITDVPSGEMFNRALAALEDMGLEIVEANNTAGIIEATDTTFWFGFKDDVVVRIRDQGPGSVVDIRSVSRVGVSDLGANARRIGEILKRLAAS